MADIVSLSEAVAQLIADGDCVAMEGFTHLIPHAAGHEVIRQRKRNLRLVRMTPDLIYDQLIGAGCASALPSASTATHTIAPDCWPKPALMCSSSTPPTATPAESPR